MAGTKPHLARTIFAVSLGLAVPLPRAECEDPEAALEHDLGLALTDVFEVELEPDVLRLMELREGLAASALDGARLFAATTEDDARRTCEVALVPLVGGSQGRVVVAMAGDRVLTAGLWGSAEFDEDPTRRWGAFLGQFRGPVAGRSPGREEFARPRNAPGGAGSNADDAEGLVGLDDPLARALLTQRRVMAKNDMLRAVSVGRNEPPPAAWLAELVDALAALADVSSELAPVLGEEGAARHQALAEEARVAYVAMAEAVEAGASERYFERREELGAVCTACHEAVVSGAQGTDFQRAARAARAQLPFAASYRPGLDLANAFGDKGGTSAEVAAAWRFGVELIQRAR